MVSLLRIFVTRSPHLRDEIASGDHPDNFSTNSRATLAALLGGHIVLDERGLVRLVAVQLVLIWFWNRDGLPGPAMICSLLRVAEPAWASSASTRCSACHEREHRNECHLAMRHVCLPVKWVAQSVSTIGKRVTSGSSVVFSDSRISSTEPASTFVCVIRSLGPSVLPPSITSGRSWIIPILYAATISEPKITRYAAMA